MDICKVCVLMTTMLTCWFVCNTFGEQSQFPENYVYAPGITKDWFNYQGRSHDSYNAVIAGIKKYKTMVWSRYLSKSNITLEQYLSSEPRGILDDILMSPSSIKERIRKFGRTRRSAIVPFDLNPQQKWSSLTIPYRVDSLVYTDKEEAVIDKAVTYWNDNTCITFQKFTASETISERSIFVTKFTENNIIDETVCVSSLGQSSETDLAQPLYLGAQCLDTVYFIAVHEFGHALGLYHIHQRMDRDTYVTIDNTKIIPSAIGNFNMESANKISTLGFDYDFGSVMHYTSRDFSKDSDLYRTIIPKDSSLLSTIGQRVELSFLDAKTIYTAYCAAICSSSTVQCANGGYPDPNDCTRCTCMDLYDGATCQNVRSGSADCSPQSGALREVTHGTECVRSPHYSPSTNNTYEEGETCSWILKAPAGCALKLWFTREAEWPRIAKLEGDVCAHYVEIKADGTQQKFGERFCGHEFTDHFKYTESNPLVTSSPTVPVLFRALPTVTQFNWQERLGFELCYTVADKSCLPLTTTTTTTTTTTLPETERCNSGRSPLTDEKEVFHRLETKVIGREYSMMLEDSRSTLYNVYQNELKSNVERVMCEKYGVKFNKISAVIFRQDDGLIAEFTLEFIVDQSAEGPVVDDLVKLLDGTSSYQETKSDEANTNGTQTPSLSTTAMAAIGFACGILIVASVITACIMWHHKHGRPILPARKQQGQQQQQRPRRKQNDHLRNFFGMNNTTFMSQSDISSNRSRFTEGNKNNVSTNPAANDHRQGPSISGSQQDISGRQHPGINERSQGAAYANYGASGGKTYVNDSYSSSNDRTYGNANYSDSGNRRYDSADHNGRGDRAYDSADYNIPGDRNYDNHIGRAKYMEDEM